MMITPIEIHAAAQDYEFAFDDGRTYAPTKAERAMLEDFGNSLLSERGQTHSAVTPNEVATLQNDIATLLATHSLNSRNEGEALRLLGRSAKVIEQLVEKIGGHAQILSEQNKLISGLERRLSRPA